LKIPFKRLSAGWLGNQVGRFLSGVFAGSVDETVRTFSNRDVSLAHDLVRNLVECEPWSDHITPTGVSALERAIKKRDALRARSIVDIMQTEDASSYCIDVLKSAAVMAAAGAPDILLEALPGTYY
jgi:hypothetical protein